MSEKERKLLQQQLTFYTELLKKHEAKSGQHKNLHTVPMPAQTNDCKLSSFNSIKTKSFSNEFTKSSQCLNNSNKRTVIQKNKFVSYRKKVSSPPNRSAKINHQKMFFNPNNINVKNPIFTNKQSLVNSSLSPEVSNKSSKSEELLKEIDFLTNLISSKEKSVTKNDKELAAAEKSTICRIGDFNVKSKEVINQNAFNLYKPKSQLSLNVDKSSLKNCQFSKTLKSRSELTLRVENNQATHILNQPTKISFSPGNTAISSFRKVQKTFPTKRSLPKVQTYTKSVSKVHSDHHLRTPSFSPKVNSIMLVKSKTPLSSKYFRKSVTKSSVKSSKLIKAQNSKLKFNYINTSPKNQKLRKLNTKYKVVNKNAQNFKKTLKTKPQKSSFLDESDVQFELLDNQDIDKLEQELLAFGTSPGISDASKSQLLINSPSSSCKSYLKTTKQKSLCSKYKIVNSSLNHKTEKLVLKKTPVKKLKLLSSQYKVVNKNLSTPNKSFLFLKRNTPARNIAKKTCKKMVLTKYSLVNKHSPVLTSTKSNPVLVKRLYKSKSTLINKNGSPVSFSAKLIKSKYFGAKKKSTFQHQYWNPKIMQKSKKFTGSYEGRKQFNRHKYLTYPENSRGYSTKINYISNSKHYKRTMSLKKRNKVLNIQGSRYSISLSGKKIKRLPTKGQLSLCKTPRKLFITGKSLVRTPENNVKALCSPSLHLANRVLHRSISRVITASTKKSLSKINTYCMFYNRFGRCNRGVKCPYIHDPSKIAVCTRFLRGTCKTKECPFSHEVTPGKMAICSYFLVGACDKNDCPYRHEPLSPNAVLCKAFVQGYCPKGKECNKAHILICPKFILGECDKGRSCAYPHPPQKAKKSISKDTIDQPILPYPEGKENDGFLEKVARYFQAEGKCIDLVPEKNVKTFVARPRKLEEQPAFIPLFKPDPETDSVSKLG